MAVAGTEIMVKVVAENNQFRLRNTANHTVYFTDGQILVVGVSVFLNHYNPQVHSIPLNMFDNSIIIIT